MAYLFSLSAECSSDRTIADRFAEHFEGLSFNLSTGTESKCENWIHEDPECNWWVTVIPSDISRSGVNSENDCIELSELGFRLYKHLLSAPPFRYALAGIEVDDFSYYTDLFKSVCTYPDGRNALHGFTGLVLQKELWQELGKPISFGEFGPDHLWVPYYGRVVSLARKPDTQRFISRTAIIFHS